MSKDIYVSLDEMDSVITRLNNHATNISDKSSLLNTKVSELNGRDWNEETGRNITSNLEEAGKSISLLVQNINEMKSSLQKIRDVYAEQYTAYTSQSQQ